MATPYQVEVLITYALTNPFFTCHDVERDLGWGIGLFDEVKHDVRVGLGHLRPEDSVGNLVCLRQPHGPGLYVITNDPELIRLGMRPMIRTCSSHLVISHSMTSSLVAMTTSDPVVRDPVLQLEWQLGRNIEDLDGISELILNGAD